MSTSLRGLPRQEGQQGAARLHLPRGLWLHSTDSSTHPGPKTAFFFCSPYKLGIWRNNSPTREETEAQRGKGDFPTCKALLGSTPGAPLCLGGGVCPGRPDWSRIPSGPHFRNCAKGLRGTLPSACPKASCAEPLLTCDLLCPGCALCPGSLLVLFSANLTKGVSVMGRPSLLSAELHPGTGASWLLLSYSVICSRDLRLLQPELAGPYAVYTWRD